MKHKTTLTALTLTAIMATGFSAMVQAQTPPGSMMGGAMMGGAMGMAPFAKIDTNGDKVLSPDEIHAYVASQIAGLDANHDGFLTADEIAAKMTQLAHDRILARATEMMPRLDKSADGKISVDALAKMPMPMDRMVERLLKAGGGKITKETFDSLQAMRGGKGPGMGEGHGPKEGGWRNWWHHRFGGDQGRDGEHGPMGMMGGMGPMGPEMMGPDLEIKFSDIDTANHGYITADDIHAYKLARIKAIDANADGFITPDEFATFALAKMEPRIKAHADELVKRLDLNADGKLSIEELAAAPLDMMLADLPTDKDGNVTEQGFMQAMQDHGPGGRHQHGGMMAPDAMDGAGN
jgi:hypothetical protein